jgi:hypothetical protein
MAGAKVECTQMTFQVRRAGPADAEAIAEAHCDSIASIGPRFYPADLVKEWGARIESGMYCRDSSFAAVKFYRAHGFRETGRGDHRLRSGSLMPCVFMRKDLERSVRL